MGNKMETKAKISAVLFFVFFGIVIGKNITSKKCKLVHNFEFTDAHHL